MNMPRLFKIQREGDTIIVDLQSEVSSLVDFEQVAYFGSIMLEALRALWNQVSAAGGKLALCNVSAAGREILELARFDTIWTIYETRAEAIKAVHNG